MDPESREWLETDGLGGFACGTVAGVRTRRYHALLLVATTPPCGRFVLVNGFDAWLETAGGTSALTSQRYAPDVIHPDSGGYPESFALDPWPVWVWRLKDGTRVQQEVFVCHGLPVVALRFRLLEAQEPAILALRPFLSGRDYHALHTENPVFRFTPEIAGERVTWRPYAELPAIVSLSNGRYFHEPYWYRGFLYSEERARGLDYIEDLASPGVLRWDLNRSDALWILAAGQQAADAIDASRPVQECFARLQAAERRRRAQFRSPLERAADAYLVRRGSGRTIIAGYPWFTDWGRDTMIAVRGLCIATGRLDEARSVLLTWAEAISQGMLPNHFPDRGWPPEYNSVDAGLWFVIAVHDLLNAAQRRNLPVPAAEQRQLSAAIEAILSSYAAGTRYRIHQDSDGLLAAGEPGVQLTWMDAKVGDWVVTPRIGKPVEVQALWLAALWLAGQSSARWRAEHERGRESFVRRFWNEAEGCLYDVVDCDHRPGSADRTLRPNQILAVGGLPIRLLDEHRARLVVETVERRLWCPLGLLSLAPGEAGFAPRYEGNVWQRDAAYHQGTAWPWLLGPFVEAWVRVHGGSPGAKSEARERFVAPLLRHLDEAGLGHISEIADATWPHVPRGCPFQACSLGELLRLELDVLQP
jgi:predicted glycogen debranching enzyme